MKNLICLFVILFAASVFADIGPVNRSITLDNAGAVQAGANESYFVNVLNVSNGALVDGQPVVLDTTSDNEFSVTTSASVGARPHCVLNEACAIEKLCECQIRGRKSNVQFDSTSAVATVGQAIYMSQDNAGYVGSLSAAPAATDWKLGVALDSASSSGDLDVFIDLR
jgi:hypothetical protein